MTSQPAAHLARPTDDDESNGAGVSMPAQWGRWGADDEVGALNLVTRDVVLSAVGLVREGRVFSLAQPHGPVGCGAPHRPDTRRFMVRDAGDYASGARSPNGFRFAEDVVQFASHNGTHVDALSHAWRGDHLYNGHPAASIRSTQGAQKLGAETLRPVLTRGVLLDLVSHHGGPLPASHRVTADQLDAAYERAGVTPAPADAVLLRTGWYESADPVDYYDNEPGLTRDAAEYLAALDVSLVGADNYAIEVQPSDPGQTFPAHLVLVHEHGVPLLENLHLAELARAAVATFLLAFAPIPLTGSTASPVTPLAVL